jgi:Glycosyl transferase family 2
MQNTALLLTFINNLSSAIQLEQILSIEPHPDLTMSGWLGVCALVGKANNKLYDIDVRWAAQETIFYQDLWDFGWNEQMLLANRNQERHKLIIYLCDPGMKMIKQGVQALPTHFLIGLNWTSLTHCYTQDPHPFTLPEPDKLVTGYATTAKLTDRVPKMQREFDGVSLFIPNVPQGGLRTKGLFKNADPAKPLLSIVTVVYNGEKYLEQTIQSVINQSYKYLEYIIIDGGSTDRTLEIIAKYNDHIDYWISEPDTGIYNAMNKGTKLATGSHVLHLNADDLLFEPQGLEFLNIAHFDDNHMRSILKVNLQNGRMAREPITMTKNSLAEHVTYQNHFLQISHTAMVHPGFINRINATSIFSEEYRIFSDTVMLIKKFNTESVRLSSVPLSIFRSGGASSNNRLILTEMWQEIRKQPALWPKISRWLQLQGVFAVWK